MYQQASVSTVFKEKPASVLFGLRILQMVYTKGSIISSKVHSFDFNDFVK